MLTEKVLVTGGNGTVASYIDFGAKSTREDFDITNFSQTIEFVKKISPSVIIHLAAETDLKKCEADPAHAYKVNTVGTYNLAMAAKKVGAKMVYVSTDAVFPRSIYPHGLKEVPEPESVYGHSKYLGEFAVRGISNNHIIARTSWVFGGGAAKDKKFVAQFVAKLQNPKTGEMYAVYDQYSSPTYAKDLAVALKQLIVRKKKGIFHVVNAGIASRHDMAMIIAETLKNTESILPVTAATLGIPPYLFSSGGLASNLGLRPWHSALKEYVQTEWSERTQ